MTKTLLTLLATAILMASNAVLAIAQPLGRPVEISSSDVRTLLSNQLSEHVLLLMSSTGAALSKRTAESEAALKALDDNSVDLSKSIGVVYGNDRGNAFLPLWRKHIDFLQDYATAVGAKDQAKADQAANDLIAYSREFAAFIAAANPRLPRETVTKLAADLVKEHVLGLKDAIDAQASGDFSKAYQATRTAYAHMDMIAKVLADVITKQFPGKFDGAIDSPDAELRVAVNKPLAEHAYLAAAATNAALAGRTEEFDAAAKGLDDNAADLAKSLGSIYGTNVEDAFLPLWRELIGLVEDYATGLATKDKPRADSAVKALIAYSQDFGAFLNSASPSLSKDEVAKSVQTHILGLKDVMDAQVAGDQARAFSALRGAYAHMATIADPLAAAIVQQFPDRFGGQAGAQTGTATGMSHSEAPLPVTGGSPLDVLVEGGLRWLVLMLFGLGLVVSGAGLLLRRRGMN